MRGRDLMESAVRRELVGPVPDDAPRGKPIDTSASPLSFETWEQARGPWHDLTTGQEVLSEIEPLRRYGVGVLYGEERLGGNLSGVTGLPEDDKVEDAPAMSDLQPSGPLDPDSDDFDLTDANSFQPSAMAISFKARLAAGSELHVSATAAAYERVVSRVHGAKRDRDWWVRRPFTLTAIASTADLLERIGKPFDLPAEGTPTGRADPRLRAYSRPVPGETDPARRLITIVLINTTSGSGSGAAIFQAAFEVKPAAGALIEAYPEQPAPKGMDREDKEEEESIALLYRRKLTFAVGHGCAAGWDSPAGDGTVTAVRAEPMPAYDVPSLTPEIRYQDRPGSSAALHVSMAALAEGSAEGGRQVDLVLDLYEQWIGERETEAVGLADRFRGAADRHLQLCREALARMRIGWQLATTDPIASRAFQLANLAMLTQQARSRLPVRAVNLSKDGLFRIAAAAPEPLASGASWRPFQIAFLLATLPEIVQRGDSARPTVDLIFFPTGGGKTEAYLGVAAASMIARRLRDPQDVGTDVLMRYTLRLLTAQQFQRAAALTCALESIRRDSSDLGTEPFSIGIWLGGASTPNTWKSAKTSLSRLRDPRAENPFLLLSCPWCATQMGPIARSDGKGERQVAGYVPSGSRVTLRCPATDCKFRGGLPVQVVDEAIYERPPSLLIGTVDKFAMLAWKREARTIFGIDSSGTRSCSPPGLIIQDELHLISGPLGSMVGLYEPLLEDLCTDHRSDPPTRVKVVASTATIRRFAKQVRNLYGREQVALFPPHGLEEGRSFFAEPATRQDGSPADGRRYLGVMSPSLGSTQTVQVRVAAATLQAGRSIPAAERDGYWTNINFLNSLRELGNTVSLLQSDIPDYLTGMRNRDGLESAEIRWPRIVMELTSRRRSDEIPRAIEELKRQVGTDGCVDVCLASSIIEVGIDIDRLALMTIVGQPKTTAQYIQVSGRVGRRWWERPGLVLTIYGAAKPRDRSHYERFRSYHQRLYAQVEPTSLTPFALPVLLRGLHGAAVAHIRQSAPEDLPPYPFPQARFDSAVALIMERAAIADAPEIASLAKVARRRAREWSRWERTAWSANPSDGDPLQGLMRYPETSPAPASKALSWEVPTSMRSVDAECQVQITTAYALESAAEPEELE